MLARGRWLVGVGGASPQLLATKSVEKVNYGKKNERLARDGKIKRKCRKIS